jgi:hypothetical protein
MLSDGFRVSAEFNHLGLKLGFFKWKAWIYNKIPRFFACTMIQDFGVIESANYL